jgi:hypothetical protein
MKLTGLILILLALMVSATAAQYHDPVYVMGGYATTSTAYWNGPWLVNSQAKTLKHLTPNDMFYYNYNGIIMDVNNRDVIYAAYGTTSSSYSTWKRSGIYRIDPNTLQVTTVKMDTMAMYGPRGIMINQDGDYVFACYQTNPTNYAFLKLDYSGTTLTTVLDSTKLGTSSYATTYGLGRDMDTGLYLFNLYLSNTFYYSVIRYDETNNAFTTFGGGNVSSMYGWYGYYSQIEQNHDTGHIEGYYSRNLYQLKQGAPSRTTLWQLGLPGNFTMQYCGKFDLQSAPNPRHVATGYTYHPVGQPNTFYWYSPAVFYVDANPPYTVTAIDCDPNYTSGIQRTGYYARGLDFFRGRHLQTFKQAAGKWDLLISCPNFPNRAYVVALSMSGYRPAISLPDGRRIHLVPDMLTQLSLSNLLSPIFNPGPLVLNARGEAVARFDVSALPKLGGLPIWFAVAVLDPKAPNGVAYLPDTEVLRLP